MVNAIRRADLVYVISPPLSFAFLALQMAKLLGVPRILCVKDVLPDAAIELGMVKNRAMITVSRWLARRSYALAQEIHTLGEGMRRRIMREAPSPGKIRVVSDTIDSQELVPVPYSINEFRRRFVPEGVFAVVHSGNMGRKQDLDLLIRAAARLRDEPMIHFYVFGDGAVKQEFLQRRDALKLSNVSLHPLQERWMLTHVLSGADVLLVSQLAEVVDIAVPSKLLTALAAGAMILAACARDSETARIVDESGGGMVIPAGDDAALVQQIQQIRNGAVNITAYRTRAREYALRVFGRDAVYGPLVDDLRRMARPRRASRGYGRADGDLMSESYKR
jgi:colanic acid biosynthesis glycosyl transferase WcaI